MTKPWYEVLYEDFPNYGDEPYVKATEVEIDYIHQALGSLKGLEVLDIGCGTGRHALEFARRGASVCGLDLSEEMLAIGQEQARQEGLPVRFFQGDARHLDYLEEFDVVTSLCEGGFSLMETDQMDRQILEGAARALRPGGGLFLTAPSAAGMLANLNDDHDFDPLSLREIFTLETENSQGEKVSLECSQRYYTYPELDHILSRLGFQKIAPFAVTGEGYADAFFFSTDQFELGVMASKSDRRVD